MGEIEKLKHKLAELQNKLEKAEKVLEDNYYLSDAAVYNRYMFTLPENGMPAKSVKTQIENNHELDFNFKLNTSSYVNVSFEKEENEIALMGLRVNLADQTVYPASYKMHDSVVNMIANLWHCPKPVDFDEYGVFAGAGTVGSTEACLLAGLALKFRWRKWFAKRNNLTEATVIGERPNLVISSCYQAAWEKLFKYMLCLLIRHNIPHIIKN
jgi:glutamate decarboxylase